MVPLSEVNVIEAAFTNKDFGMWSKNYGLHCEFLAWLDLKPSEGIPDLPPSSPNYHLRVTPLPNPPSELI